MKRAVTIARKLCPRANASYIEAFDRGDALLAQHGITTPLRLAHFLAQVFHETGGLTVLREDMRYRAPRIMEIFGVGRHSAGVTQAEAARLAGDGPALAERVYGLGNPRKARELGNTKPGDGWRYRGNGIMQTTGRGNHRRMGERCGEGCDFEGRPDLVTDPDYALKPALAEWTEGRLNVLADRNDLKSITRKINGGYNGLADRRAWFDRIWKEIGGPADAVEPKTVAEPDPEVIECQEKLQALGYKVSRTGFMNDETQKALRDFQTKAEIRADGLYGPVTEAAMDLRLSSTKAPSEPTVEKPNTIEEPKKVGRDLFGGVTLMVILEWIFKFSEKVGQAPVLQYVIIGLAVIGVGMFLYGVVRPKIWKPKPGEVAK
jgi:putative chitinase